MPTWLLIFFFFKIHGEGRECWVGHATLTPSQEEVADCLGKGVWGCTKGGVAEISFGTLLTTSGSLKASSDDQPSFPGADVV